MREIKDPEGVDSIGKLNEWLAECGMPQRDSKPALDESGPHDDASRVPAVSIQWENWGLGFKFERGNREEANKGYRELIKFAAQGLYARFHDERYAEIIWRVRPELDEQICLTKLVNADGTDCHLEDDADDLPEGVYHVDTGYSAGKFFCRLGLVMQKCDGGTHHWNGVTNSCCCGKYPTMRYGPEWPSDFPCT